MARTGKLQREELAWVALAFMIGAAAAAYLTWPGLISDTTYASGLRQVPHRALYHFAFRADDLVMEYSRFNESPLQNALFYLATFFTDAVRLSNVLAVIAYGCCSAWFYLSCSTLYDRQTGLLAAIFFSLLPNQIGFFSDTSARQWGIPLLLCCLYLLQVGRHRWFVALLPFCALAYPPIAVLVGMTAVGYVGFTIWSDRQVRWKPVRYLLLGGLLAVLTLLPKYAWPPPTIGPMVSGATLRAMPEMYEHGMSSYLPLLPLHSELFQYVRHPFTILSGLLFLIALRPKHMIWEKSWSALLAASAIGYVVAELTFMRLYLPDRFTKYSMAVLLILWSARHWALTLERLRRPWVRRAAFAALVMVGALLYRGQLAPGSYSLDKQRYAAVCAYVRTLPEDALIAGHPHTMDEIPLQGHRAVLCNYVMSHPWFSKYYEEMRRRLQASLRAVYATDSGQVDELYTRYGVTHLVINKEYLHHGRHVVHDREPYSTYEQTLLADRAFVLDSPPPRNVLYEDSRYLVIELPLEPTAPAPSDTLHASGY